jgi:hypothetical protein
MFSDIWRKFDTFRHSWSTLATRADREVLAANVGRASTTWSRRSSAIKSNEVPYDAKIAQRPQLLE